MDRQGARGFSLIELMIVVVIVGVLAAIAIPGYQQYRVKANRADAQAFLMDIAQRQQQHLLDAREFAGTLAELNSSIPANVDRHYSITITVDAGPPPEFLITATPKAGGGQAADGNLTLDQSGNKEWNGQPW